MRPCPPPPPPCPSAARPQNAPWPRPRWRVNLAPRKRRCRTARTQLFSSLEWAPSSHLHQRAVSTRTVCPPPHWASVFVCLCLLSNAWRVSNVCDVPPQPPHTLQSTACTPRPSPSPALTGPSTPYSGRLIYQVGATVSPPGCRFIRLQPFNSVRANCI